MTDGTGTITTLHFAIIAVLALLVVIGIVAGIRMKRGRVLAEREVESHAAEAGVAHEPPAEEPQQAAPPPAPADAPAPPAIAVRPVPSVAPSLAEPVAEPSLADEPPRERRLADEPIAAIAPDGTTAAVAVDPEVADAPSPSDGPVTQIKGLGPRVAARLAELGIERVGQLAALDSRQAETLDAELGAFTGRMGRDRWLEQARLLAAGDRDGFERTFGKL